MTVLKSLIGGLSAALVLSLSATQVFAACSTAEQDAAGHKIAAAAKAELGDTLARQNDRLVKIYDCQVEGDVTYVSFTYNFVSADDAYAVDGDAEITDGKAELRLRAPSRVWASIETAYFE